MLEAAYILAGVSVMLLFGALLAWTNLTDHPRIRRTSGSAAANAGNHQLAALLLFAAVGLSAMAATLAMANWFAG